MSYKSKMHPPVSNADERVLEELSKLGLAGAGMRFQQTIILKKTTPEYCWNDRQKAVYLDGEQVHPEGDEWDLEAQRLLEMRGWEVKRIRYHAPLTMKRLTEIVREIQDFLGVTADERAT